MMNVQSLSWFVCVPAGSQMEKCPFNGKTSRFKGGGLHRSVQVQAFCPGSQSLVSEEMRVNLTVQPCVLSVCGLRLYFRAVMVSCRFSVSNLGFQILKSPVLTV